MGDMKWILIFFPFVLFSQVQLGINAFFEDGHAQRLKGKNVVLVTNHTAVDHQLCLSADRFLNAPFKLIGLWTPEHGLQGLSYASEHVVDSKYKNGVPVLSLHGDKKRPTQEMFKGVDAVVYDIQDIGLRSYTFASTLYLVMEEAARFKVPVVVLDRPNPLGGLMVDGPMLCQKLRSFVGYLNVPYCHGMTIGELAQFFNSEYKVGCDLKVVAMKGWSRSMSYGDTKLKWIPTSPHVPEMDTPLYCATTGVLGELGIVNIGVGYTLPFKLVGAPWIDAEAFTKALNAQNRAGVRFVPFHYRPFYGLFKGQDCHGVMIDVTDKGVYQPLSTGYMITGVLKSLYPKQFLEQLGKTTPLRKELFCKVNGNEAVLKYLLTDPYPAWKCISYEQAEREAFKKIREKYLIYN